MGASTKNIDFSNVKDGGGNFTKKRVKAGDYAAKIIKVEDAETKDSKEFQYLFTIQLVKHPTATYPYYCQLTEKSLWKLRNLFIAAGKSVPKRKTTVNPNHIVGKLIGVTMDDTEYKDKEQSEIGAVFPAADLSDGDGDEPDDTYDENDEEADDEEEEELESDEEEDVEEEEEAEGDEWDAITDRTELRRALKKVAPDVQTKASQSEDDIRDLIRAAVAGDDEEVEDEEEEEEEPEPPKKAKKATPPAKKTKKKSSDVSDDELEELDIDDL